MALGYEQTFANNQKLLEDSLLQRMVVKVPNIFLKSLTNS
ncbi:hypothetical protein METHP14_280021 [Pseudomonas sp. P14-2025]